MRAAGVLVCVVSAAVLTQAPSTSVAESVVLGAARVLSREYFDAAAGERAARELGARYDSGRYRAATTNQALADLLTEDLRELTRDKHVAVMLRRSGGAGGPAERRDVPTTAGFRRSEILTGGIGVLDLAFFMRLSEHRDAMADAMKTLEPARVLIIDMRNNGGGSPDTVALLVSYVLAAADTPLFDIVRRDGSRDVYTTGPAVLPHSNGRRPVFVLTSARTFSGGEGLAFLLQERKRAVVVGETTAGAANPGRPYPIDDTFEIAISNGQLLSALSRRNWEGLGVVPDVSVPADDALDTAMRLASRLLAQ